MIYEYALEPEMVATWGTFHNSRFFSREFGLGQARIVSRYPKKWAKEVWDAFGDGNDSDRMRLTELLVQLKQTMVERKNCSWDSTLNSWFDNAIIEHDRYPFKAIVARSNPENRPEIIIEDNLNVRSCLAWDAPHSISVHRKAPEMAVVIEMMLARCLWVKFIDPHLSPDKRGYSESLRVFLNILAGERPVGPPEYVEIHTALQNADEAYFRRSFEKFIPAGLQVTLFQWQERPGGQSLHNRYILTDLGGVSFHHGLDAGHDGDTDDITRLDCQQYELYCKQYNQATPAFDQAEPPLVIIGIS